MHYAFMLNIDFHHTIFDKMFLIFKKIVVALRFCSCCPFAAAFVRT
jgi:hypothetical protein